MESLQAATPGGFLLTAAVEAADEHHDHLTTSTWLLSHVTVGASTKHSSHKCYGFTRLDHPGSDPEDPDPHRGGRIVFPTIRLETGPSIMATHLPHSTLHLHSHVLSLKKEVKTPAAWSSEAIFSKRLINMG